MKACFMEEEMGSHILSDLAMVAQLRNSGQACHCSRSLVATSHSASGKPGATGFVDSPPRCTTGESGHSGSRLLLPCVQVIYLVPSQREKKPTWGLVGPDV